MQLKTLRLWIWGVVIVAALAMTGAALLVRQPWGGAPFTLVDHTGAPITENALEGHPVALFFGFTQCPEICPTTLFEMASWIEELGDEGAPLRAFFISVDPERDTVEEMNWYVTAFSDRITGITGDADEIAKLVESWHVYVEIIPLDDGDYTVDHTSSVFLVDRNGTFKSTIAWGEDRGTALAKLRNLIAS